MLKSTAPGLDGEAKSGEGEPFGLVLSAFGGETLLLKKQTPRLIKQLRRLARATTAMSTITRGVGVGEGTAPISEAEARKGGAEAKA